MKKLLIAILATIALTGCASRTGTAVLAGTTGLIIGNAMAQPRVVLREPAPVVTHEQVVIVNNTCGQYQLHSERAACERGARQRYYEEQRKRETEAYRQGYGK